MLTAAVHPADIQDRDGALQVLDKQMRAMWSFVRTVFADGGYAGDKLELVLSEAAFKLEIVRRPADMKGFQVLPKRWVVERTFAWLGRCRRLSKDYENLSRMSLAFLRLAMIRIMARRLARA